MYVLNTTRSSSDFLMVFQVFKMWIYSCIKKLYIFQDDNKRTRILLKGVLSCLYFMFPQKQAWFPCTNKFIPYSNAWHIYAKVLEIKTFSTVFFSTRPVSHFFLFSSFIKSEWRVDSETHCKELHLTGYWQRPQKWTNFFFSFALTNCALHCWEPTSLPYTLVYVNNVIY